MEWIMTESEVRKWRFVVTKDSRALHELKRYLSTRQLTIGSRTFSTGMTIVLYQSCASSSYDIAEYLLQTYTNHYNVNQLISVNPDPYRPFPSNAICDKIAIVKTTLSHASVLGSSIQIIKLLLNHGASLNTPNCCNKVPIMVAIENHNLEMVNFLLSLKVDQNCKDHDGLTPLMYITREPLLCHLIPDIVLSAGIDLSVTDNRGYTALHIAMYEGTANAVDLLLQMSLLKDIKYFDVPHPSVLFDCKDGILFMKHARAIYAILEKYSNSFTPRQQVDVHLVHAVLLLHDTLTIKQNSITFYKHKMVEAFMLKKQLGIPCDSNSNEMQSYEQFQSFLNDSIEQVHVAKIKEAVMQSVLILERCVGNGSKMLFDFAKTASMRMIQNEEYEYGLTLFGQLSDMLVHVSNTAHHPSLPLLKRMTFDFLLEVKTVFNSKLSDSAQHKRLTEIVLISAQQEIGTQFNSIFSNIVHSLAFTLPQVRQIHSHTITLKSTTLSLLELFEIFKSIFKDPDMYDINVTQIIIELIEKCPTTLIDFNGNPTTILHLALSSNPSRKLIKMILENGGDYLINEVGPCGNRPLQITFDESLIQMLLEYDPHLDAVDMKGKNVFNSIKTFMSDGALPFSNIRRLDCICCRIVAQSFPYHSMDLPVRVKRQILLHDQMAESILSNEELMFVQ